MKLANFTLGLAFACGSLAFGQTSATSEPMAPATTPQSTTKAATDSKVHGMKPNNTNVLVDQNGKTVSVTKVRRKHHKTETKVVSTEHRDKATMP